MIKVLQDGNPRLQNEKHEVEFDSFTFPAGEESVKFKRKSYVGGAFTIIAKINSSAEVMKLALINDALKRMADEKINLFIPYLPYARQDRACVEGEAFSLKVFAEFINHLNFNTVTVADPHSDVINDSLIKNLKVISQLDIIGRFQDFKGRVIHSELLSVDAGSNKKMAKIAKYFGHKDFVRCDKLRDLSNGNIKETIVYKDDFGGKDVVALDDLCDGGKSFTELAKVCKVKNCGKFILYVTHGIFSKGADVLFDGGIDECWTTNSYKDDFDPRIKVLKLEERFTQV